MNILAWYSLIFFILSILANFISDKVSKGIAFATMVLYTPMIIFIMKYLNFF